eukprot:TRINITY_DN7451_c0_g1_i2.p2 TRINITY_DN7451_c0_g1~~TRINITY_DN7451_c0_g1_i2.p2  ORF type:complete len:131 (+),score=20.30 TRINITY_DN7451_c0_g1_i2:91-483(+)
MQGRPPRYTLSSSSAASDVYKRQQQQQQQQYFYQPTQYQQQPQMQRLTLTPTPQLQQQQNLNSPIVTPRGMVENSPFIQDTDNEYKNIFEEEVIGFKKDDQDLDQKPNFLPSPAGNKIINILEHCDQYDC